MRLKEQFSYFRSIFLNLSRRICWKHRILLKIKSITIFLIIVCRNFSEQWSSLMVGLWLKLQMKNIYSSSTLAYLHLNVKNCNVFICKDTSQATKTIICVNSLSLSIDFVKLFLLKVPSCMFEGLGLHLWPDLTHAVN